jgi:hypothetical protein
MIVTQSEAHRTCHFLEGDRMVTTFHRTLAELDDSLDLSILNLLSTNELWSYMVSTVERCQSP